MTILEEYNSMEENVEVQKNESIIHKDNALNRLDLSFIRHIDLKEYKYPNQYAPYTWEGCVVKISDKISYIGRDIEDAIIVGTIKREDIPEEITKVLGNTNAQIVNKLIMDVIENSINKPYLKFSDEV